MVMCTGGEGHPEGHSGRRHKRPTGAVHAPTPHVLVYVFSNVYVLTPCVLLTGVHARLEC
jgi:hypothetical protein